MEAPRTAGERLAAIALSVAPCNPFDPDLGVVMGYFAFLTRPLDPASAKAYYASRGLSTCALTVLAAYRVAGLSDLEVTAAYYPGRVGKAFSDVQALGARYGAWEGRPDLAAAPLRAGDVWVITAPDGSDGHMGLAVGDQGDDDVVATVEGGQVDPHGGSSAIGSFVRRLFPTPGGWKMGSRVVYGVVRAAKMPLPDPVSADSGDPLKGSLSPA